MKRDRSSFVRWYFDADAVKCFVGGAGLPAGSTLQSTDVLSCEQFRQLAPVTVYVSQPFVLGGEKVRGALSMGFLPLGQSL